MSKPASRRKTQPRGNSLLTSNPDIGAPNPLFADATRRHELIERAAYLRAERRGFEPGHEIEDWCGAEQEINARLFRGEIPSP